MSTRKSSKARNTNVKATPKNNAPLYAYVTLLVVSQFTGEWKRHHDVVRHDPIRQVYLPLDRIPMAKLAAAVADDPNNRPEWELTRERMYELVAKVKAMSVNSLERAGQATMLRRLERMIAYRTKVQSGAKIVLRAGYAS